MNEGPTSGSNGEYEERSLSQILRAVQQTPLPIPLQNPVMLPLSISILRCSSRLPLNISRDPALSPTYQFKISTDTVLSRFRLLTKAKQLRVFALLAAAESYLCAR